MPYMSSNVGVCYFVSQTNNLIHETTKVFYRFRKEYPIDDHLLEKCSILSAAYYFRRMGIVPSLDVIKDLGMGEEELQEIVYFYDRFSIAPDACFYDYSSEIENLIEYSAQTKGIRGFILVPQFRGKKREIEGFLAYQNVPAHA